MNTIANPTENNDLVRAFVRTFGRHPDWQIRAPGRVNLIGDHTDYNDLPVFPMAMQRRITLVGAARTDDVVQVENVDRTFDRVTYRLASNVQPGPSGSWGNYVKAGPRAVSEAHGATIGFDALVSGNIPVAAGLSSSSALVVACGLAACRANNLSLALTDMAVLMARAERFVGTQGGGMDQAVCLGGRKGAAVRIDFAPLRLQIVDIPTNWSFLVANSLERAEKSGSAQAHYNQRVNDCAQGLQHLSRALGCLDLPAGHNYQTLLAAYGSEHVLATAEHVLPHRFLTRVRHTVSEAVRVDRAVQAMKRDDRRAFGELMIASHASLRDDYEVSIPALDQLVDIMLRAGCDGARLTGAGFGGCVVGLCGPERIANVRAALTAEFYRPRAVTDLDNTVFVAEASAGGQADGRTGGRRRTDGGA